MSFLGSGVTMRMLLLSKGGDGERRSSNILFLAIG